MKTGTKLSLTVHPQAEIIRNQNRHLQTEAAHLIVERDALNHSVIPNIKAEYQIKLGALEWRVFQLGCEIRAFIRRIEMAQSALNRGEEPVYQIIEAEIKTEFAAWSEQIKQQAREIKAAQERADSPTLSAIFLSSSTFVGPVKSRRRWVFSIPTNRKGRIVSLVTETWNAL